MMCEQCWADAYQRSHADPLKNQVEHYRDLLIERMHHACTPQQQAGQFWDETMKRDNREARTPHETLDNAKKSKKGEDNGLG